MSDQQSSKDMTKIYTVEETTENLEQWSKIWDEEENRQIFE